MRLHLAAGQYANLREYLYTSAERVAFLFTCLSSDQDTRVVGMRLLGVSDYLRRDDHGVELAEHVRPGLIRTAHEHGYAVAETHAHGWPGAMTQFSRIDLEGLQELGPHMTWRLPGRSYTALVFGPDSFDALQWRPDGQVTTIDALVAGGAHLRPTGLSIIRLAGIASGSPT